MTAPPLLRLVRAGMLFSPGADVIAGMCLAGLPWSWLAVRGVAASLCLYAGGMVLNDHADRRQDAIQRPERPIPSGQIRPGTALGLGATLLLLGILLAPQPLYHATMAVLVLLYDYVLKRQPLVGAVTMGLLRAANLASGAQIAVQIVVPPRTVLAAAAVYGAYIVAVTVLGILEDRPRAPRRAVLGVQLVPPVAVVAIFLVLARGAPIAATAAAAIAFAAAAAFVARALRVREWTQREIRVSMTWLLLGTMLYTGLLCLASNRLVEGILVLACILPARWISRRIALT